MTRRELARLGGALLLGAAVAFPFAAMVVSERNGSERPVREGQAEMRQMFSPDVRGDPYVRDQLRQQVEALEAHCRAAGELCAEARGARERLEELASD